MKLYKKAILPVGFMASAASSGIKRSGKLDVALFYSEPPAKAAATFTANTIQGAPLAVCKSYLKHNRDFRAIIVNSGNANALTGAQGIKDAIETTKATAKILGVKRESVLVASTGVIARRLPLDKIKRVLPQLTEDLSSQGIQKAKKAIMTTDTFTKEITAKVRIGRETITICGIAKGAGMIAPHMATMLAFIFTDATIGYDVLKVALGNAVAGSFNTITVDGCMSTNDMVMIMANGAGGAAIIKPGTPAYALFNKALLAVCDSLARMIVRDGEGATKFIQIEVTQAKSYAEAKQVALGIANSNLFKCAVYGENYNALGRIAAGIGATGVKIKEKDLGIKISALGKKDITIRVALKRGKKQARVYTSDLTPEYVKINAGYN